MEFTTSTRVVGRVFVVEEMGGLKEVHGWERNRLTGEKPLASRASGAPVVIGSEHLNGCPLATLDGHVFLRLLNTAREVLSLLHVRHTTHR